MATFNTTVITVRAERQHADVCKAMDKVWDRKQEKLDAGEELTEVDDYPMVWLDFDRCDVLDDRLRIFMECLDCGASGFIDLMNQDGYFLKPIPAKKRADDRGNRMGGHDVSAKYAGTR